MHALPCLNFHVVLAAFHAASFFCNFWTCHCCKIRTLTTVYDYSFLYALFFWCHQGNMYNQVTKFCFQTCQQNYELWYLGLHSWGIGNSIHVSCWLLLIACVWKKIVSHRIAIDYSFVVVKFLFMMYIANLFSCVKVVYINCCFSLLS